MLINLHIKNLAVIEDLDVDFSGGLNILTGETGAGKSIILTALQLILGERASAELIRSGSQKAGVEALFNINRNGKLEKFLSENMFVNEDEPDKLYLSREISSSGNSRCYINGISVPLSKLKSAGDLIVDLHGQHQHQSLLNIESQRDLLDIYGGMTPIIENFENEYKVLLSKNRILTNLRTNKRENERKKDFLRFQIEEIKKAKLNADEENELENEIQRLRHAVKIKNSSSLCYDLLYEGETTQNPVINILSEIESEIHKISFLDKNAETFGTDISEIISKSESLASNLRAYRDSISEDPENLKYLESRKDIIYELKKKYGSSISEILQYAGKIKTELEHLENTEFEMCSLEEEIKKIKSELEINSEEISKKRKEIAKKLERQVNQLLKELNLTHARFNINFESIPIFNNVTENKEENKKTLDDEELNDLDLPFRKYGKDKIEFLFSANPGEDLKPLRKVVSGGELSRIMLALKSNLASKYQIPTIVFDEIDTGIGGETADKVGKKISEMGKNCQIICITHLPQIACYGDAHYIVEKKVENKRTFTSIDKLHYKESVKEIARMLDGEKENTLSLKHAEEMIKRKKI